MPQINATAGPGAQAGELEPVGLALERLAGYFRREQPDVVLAYLFGSRAVGRTTATSDWDVAVVLSAGLRPGLMWLARLHSEIAAVLGTDRIDVVELDRAPPSLRFRVARDGIAILERSALDALRFRVAAAREYRDTAPLREAACEHFRRISARGGAFGRSR